MPLRLLLQQEDDEGTVNEYEDDEIFFDDEIFYYDDEEDYYETEHEDEAIDDDDEEDEQEDEDYDETQDGNVEQQDVQQTLVPRVSRTHDIVDPEASSSLPIVATERHDRESPPSSGICVESSESNRSEIDGLICPICMEAWTNEGDHHICCLPCGHIYGMSCIKRWLEQRKNSAKCPQCNRRCTLKGVRRLFASQLVTVDEELQKRIQYLEAKCAALEQQHKMVQTGDKSKSDIVIMEEVDGHRSHYSHRLDYEGQTPSSQDALYESESLLGGTSDDSIRQDIAELRQEVNELKGITQRLIASYPWPIYPWPPTDSSSSAGHTQQQPPPGAYPMVPYPWPPFISSPGGQTQQQHPSGSYTWPLPPPPPSTASSDGQSQQQPLPVSYPWPPLAPSTASQGSQLSEQSQLYYCYPPVGSYCYNQPMNFDTTSMQHNQNEDTAGDSRSSG